MSKIIFAIHGLGNKPPRELLQKWWLDSIYEGFALNGKGQPKIAMEMIYWADILHPEALDPNEQDPQNPLSLTEPYLPSTGKPKPTGKNLLTKVLSYFEQQLDSIFLNKDMTLNFEKVTNKIIHNYFQDLETYYMAETTDVPNSTLPVRDLIRKRLQCALKKHRFKDILILSHSMGTIISFDVLSKLKTPKEINTFVTIGSPLGLPIIVSRIFSEQKKVHIDADIAKAPDTIRHKWYNISDIEDKVALDHTLNDDFAANKHGVQAQDLFVYNDYEANEIRNAHKIYGYLRTPEMVKIISEFLETPEANIFIRIWIRISTYAKEFFSKINLFKTRE